MSPGHAEVDVEHLRAHEVERDEDVLSHELQHELEAVGSAVGVVAAFALVASHVARAARFVRRRADRSPSPGEEGERHA